MVRPEHLTLICLSVVTELNVADKFLTSQNVASGEYVRKYMCTYPSKIRPRCIPPSSLLPPRLWLFYPGKNHVHQTIQPQPNSPWYPLAAPWAPRKNRRNMKEISDNTKGARKHFLSVGKSSTCCNIDGVLRRLTWTLVVSSERVPLSTTMAAAAAIICSIYQCTSDYTNRDSR